MHNQRAVGHSNTEKTLNMLRCYYCWPKMRGHVEQYLCNYYVCNQAKSARNAYNDLFQPLSVPEKPWVDLTIDFMIGLPKSQGFNAILMVIDQLLKEKHYIPCTEKNNSTNAKTTADLFLRHI